MNNKQGDRCSNFDPNNLDCCPNDTSPPKQIFGIFRFDDGKTRIEFDDKIRRLLLWLFATIISALVASLLQGFLAI